MALIVQKFGGSSVKDAEHLRNVADIVTGTYKNGNDVVVLWFLRRAIQRTTSLIKQKRSTETRLSVKWTSF